MLQSNALKKLQASLPAIAAALVMLLNTSANSAQAYAPMILEDSPGAQEIMADEMASYQTSLESKRLRPRHRQEVNGFFVLRGTPSPAQKFNRAKLVPCTLRPASGSSFAAGRYSCDLSKAVYSSMSLPGQDRPVYLAPGVYVLGFENTIYPGFMYIQPGQTTVINLQQIPIPAGGAVKVYRDLTSLHEQHKLYFSTYILGESFFSLADWSFGDLYVKAFGVREGVPTLGYKYCEASKEPALTDKGKRICRAWNQGSFMSIMEMFDFDANGSFKQYEVRAPGRPYAYKFGRLLVARRTTAAQAQFVNVLPGKYMVEVKNDKGEVTVAKTGAVGPTDEAGNLLTNFGWLPQSSALKLEGNATSAAPPEADSTDISSPEADEGEYVNRSETCSSARMWRTELRAYCKSNSTEGCNRATAKMCEPTFDIP